MKPDTAPEPVACVVGVAGRGRVRVRHARAAIEGIVDVSRRLALSVRELRHVAGQIVLVALAPRQRIDTGRQPVHVLIGVSRLIIARVGAAEQVAVGVLGEARGSV